TDGTIYSGGDATADWYDNNPPTQWAGRVFCFGLDWQFDDEGMGDAMVRPRQSRARLRRYWYEYFAGKRNDFRVAPQLPDSGDPRTDANDPLPLRPANDPLPLWETGEYPPLPPGLERPADVLFEISGQDDSLFNEPEQEEAEEPSVP
ncbi:MAG: hypothetical protein AAF907_08595, partial [Planctomycetota bacterium]